MERLCTLSYSCQIAGIIKERVVFIVGACICGKIQQKTQSRSRRQHDEQRIVRKELEDAEKVIGN